MIVPIEKPGSPEELVESLRHYGVKGQKWGVRKEESTSSSKRSSHGVSGLEKFPPKQAASLNLMAGKMKKAYGFQIDHFEPLTEKEGKHGMLAYVQASSKSGSNTIHMSNDPKLKKELLVFEKSGWFVPTGHHVVEGIITHESAHSLFHVVDLSGKSRKEQRHAEPLIDSLRKSAWDKAAKQAIKDGDIKERKGFKGIFVANHQSQIAKHTSEYARSSIFLEEAEAEIFTSYHWNPKPPKHVDVFMNEIHSSLGKKVQPFSGRKVTYA